MLYKHLLDKTKELTSARDILGGANTFNGKKVGHYYLNIHATAKCQADPDTKKFIIHLDKKSIL